MNLIESLRPDYFNDFFHGAMFMYDGRVHSVNRCTGGAVQCTRLHDGERVNVPNNFFMGFKVFNYPILGYRRFTEHGVSYLTRTQSVRRGLSENHIRYQDSPVTTKLSRLGLISSLTPRNNGLLVFEPKFDTADDIKLLLSAEKANVVLNEKVLIEPSVRSSEDWYVIYHNQAIVGSLDYRGRPTFVSEKYSNIISPLLQKVSNG